MSLPVELQPQVLLGLWQKYSQFSPFLVRELFPPRPNPAPGATITYDVYEYNRGMANPVARFAPAPRGKFPVRTRVSVDAITLKEELEPELEALLDGTAPGSLTESNREAAVATALRQLRLRFDRRMEWLAAQWMTGGALLSSDGVPVGAKATGTIYLDWPSVSGTAPLSFNAGFSSSHIDGAVAASWATASTDIKGDLDAARLKILEDTGIEAWDVLMNSVTHKLLLNNTLAQKSLVKNDQVAASGYLEQIWGYRIHVYDGGWYGSTDTMASGNLQLYKYIPDNLVVVFSADNVASGRFLLECSPSDAQAPPGHRGVYAWADQSPTHPHNTVYGLEWTGLPVIQEPDSIYVYTDVTSTS